MNQNNETKTISIVNPNANVKQQPANPQGNRLRTESKTTDDRESIIERPSTALTLASEGIFDGGIGLQHLHAEFAKHIDHNSRMPHANMHIIFAKTAIEAPMEVVLNSPMLSLKG